MKLFLLGLWLGLTFGSAVTYVVFDLNRPKIRVEVMRHSACFVLPGGQ